MNNLSLFQKELLKFLQIHVEDQGRIPRLQEVALRFGLGEEAVRFHLGVLQRQGFLPREQESTFPRLPSPWVDAHSISNIPLIGAIAAGVPQDSSQELIAFLPIPLEQLGIPANENIFALEVRGDSMIGKHIVEGDFVVLEKSKLPHHGDVVAALVDGQTTLKTFFDQDGKRFLQAENPAYQDIFPVEELRIQGVMTFLLRRS
jgi:repressor LexA